MLNKIVSLLKLDLVMRSLSYRNYRLFFIGQSISLIGTWIQRIATPWLIYRLTDSPFMLGLIGFIGQIPTFLLGPFAGVVSDKFDKHKIIIISQIIAMLQSIILAILFFTNKIEISHVIILNAILGIVNAFEIPARQSFVIKMIEKKEDLGNAIALNSSMVNSAKLLGPSIAGILISLTNEGICFVLNSISYIFVIISLLAMKINKNSENSRINQNKFFKNFKDGFKYTFGFKPIKAIILLLALISFMGMPYTVLMPIIAKKILNGTSYTFGFLMGASGLGALFGAYYMASRKGVSGLGRIIPLSAIFFGANLILLSLSKNFFLSVFILIFAGLGMIIQMTSSNTILQTIVDDDKRGRVMSFYTMAFMGTTPFGSLFAGLMASKIGAHLTIMFGGIICIIGGIIFALNVKKYNKMITPVYSELKIFAPIL